MNSVPAVEVELIIHVRITYAKGPSIVFVLEIGCVPSQQQGSMFSSQISLCFYFLNSCFRQYSVTVLLH